MSEPLRKPAPAPDSHSPREVPEIVSMAREAQEQAEQCVDTFALGEAVFEIIERPDVLWVGTWVWAAGNDDEPDGDALLKRYQSLIGPVPKQALLNPDWSAGISINYHNGRKVPKGLMFAQETDSAQQDGRYDLFTQPAGLYVRMRKDDRRVKKLLGKRSYEMEDLYALMEDAAARHGYRRAEDNPIGIYYHDHANGTAEYAYISVEKAAPEGYSPREVPEIISMAQEAQEQAQTEAYDASVTAFSSGGSGIIPVIHQLITDNLGENYWFNGCMRYVMECLGEPDYDYWFFAGLVGDNFTQFYPRKGNCCAVSDYLMGPEYAAWVFGQVGYTCEYVTKQELLADQKYYLRRIMAQIDRGVPVICSNWGVYVGYEDGGKTLLFLTHEWTQPKRVAVFGDKIVGDRHDLEFMIFVGEKKRDVSLAQLYRDAILRLPALLSTRTEEYVFGAAAFRAWADDIENGKYDDPAILSDDLWFSYTNYVCALATNGSCCFSFLEKARELNPDMAFLDEVAALYRKMGDMWLMDKDCLEKLGGGFDIKYKTLQKRRKRAKIVAKIREFADCVDEAVRILEKGVREV